MHNHGSTPIALHGFSDAALNGAAAVDAGTDADMSSEIRDRLASLRATASRSAAGATAAGLRDRTRPPRREYRLVATVSHHGRGAARGHYTAAVRLRDRRKAEEEEGEAWKNKNTKKGVSFRSPLVEAGRRKELPGSSRWLSFDDDRVREVCEDEVTNGEAYLLFYELN